MAGYQESGEKAVVPALTELRRVLKPGGRLIMSVDHPFAVPDRGVVHGRPDRPTALLEQAAERDALGQYPDSR